MVHPLLKVYFMDGLTILYPFCRVSTANLWLIGNALAAIRGAVLIGFIMSFLQ
jgi:hypothetical protein